MNIGIYKIVNLKNKKIYIGSSKNIERRWSEHKSDLKNNHHHSIRLQRDWNEYGENCFEFIILELIKDEKELISKEQLYLDKYKSYIEGTGYNISAFAESNKGHVLSEEVKVIISNANKGVKNGMYGKIAANAKFTKEQVVIIKNLIMQGVSPVNIAKNYNVSTRIIRDIERGKKYKNVIVNGFIPRKSDYEFTEEHKNNISKAKSGVILPEEKKGKNHYNFGRKVSEETKKKLSDVGKGRICSEETRRKLSIANKGKSKSEDTKRKISKSNKGKTSGEKSHMAKLRAEEVAKIKCLLNEGFSMTKIASLYNVSITAIYSIKVGRSWKHIV